MTKPFLWISVIKALLEAFSENSRSAPKNSNFGHITQGMESTHDFVQETEGNLTSGLFYRGNFFFDIPLIQLETYHAMVWFSQATV